MKPKKLKRCLSFPIALLVALACGWFVLPCQAQPLVGIQDHAGIQDHGETAVEKPQNELPNSVGSKSNSNSDTSVLKSTVGFPKLIFQHKITGPKVVAKPIANAAQPVIVRIVETYPHGSDFRYDIEYKTLEPGKFNIAEYLKREDGSSQPIPAIEVQVVPLLEEEEVRPYELTQIKSPFRSYYLPLLLVIGVVWVGGLLMILFYGRGKHKRPSIEQKQLTVADRMRPLIDAAIAGDLTAQQQAELERVLSGFWGKKLRLNHLTADQLRQKLREHEEASVMLKQIDSWLHRPSTDPANAIDVNALLQPYQTIDDDSY